MANNDPQPAWIKEHPTDSLMRKIPVLGRGARFRHEAAEMHARFQNRSAQMGTEVRARFGADVAEMHAQHEAAVADMQTGFYQDAGGQMHHIQDDPGAMQTAAQMRARGWTADTIAAQRVSSAAIPSPEESAGSTQIARLFADHGIALPPVTGTDHLSPKVEMAMRYQEARDRTWGPGRPGGAQRAPTIAQHPTSPPQAGGFPGFGELR